VALIGAHMSIAGGLPRAVERARLHGCEALQIFTKNASQWRARPLSAAEIEEFRALIATTGVQPAVAHASYLINLGAPPGPLRDQSLASFGEELDRAEALGLLGVVIHPGCYTVGSESHGIRLIADGVGQVLRARKRHRTMVLLEQTAGQGTSIGHRFEHLAAILESLGGSRRVGVCLDTCHLLAAGYDIRSEAGYRQTFNQFDRLIGLDRLSVIHLNDSKRPLGSRIDRHEHIGQGCLGLEPFRRLVNDLRFGRIPMLLETPKSHGRRRAARGATDIDPLDQMNLETLRGLREAPAGVASATGRGT